MNVLRRTPGNPRLHVLTRGRRARGPWRRPSGVLLVAGLVGTLGVAPAAAQAREISVGGFALVGTMRVAAERSFEAVLETNRLSLVGGGAEVRFPWAGLFVGAGAWRGRRNGSRVFVSGGEIFRLGIPVTVTVTPFELTGGMRLRRRVFHLTPYGGAGWSSYDYRETSSFAGPGEDVQERFSGFHLLGGATYDATTWLGVSGEVAWTAVRGALGRGGVSEGFGETDLGGASLRLKISLGR